MTRVQTILDLKSWTRDRFAFGGSLLKGSHPKKKRPFSRKLPLHIVLKSSKAIGSRSMLRHSSAVAQVIATQAERHSIKIFSVSNAGNHIHLLVQAPAREQLQAFLRGISARISQLLMGKDKEKAREKFNECFWDARPFSKIVNWGRAFQNVSRYLSLNSTEVMPGLSRAATRIMFDEIHKLLRSGCIPRSHTLAAAGFT